MALISLRDEMKQIVERQFQEKYGEAIDAEFDKIVEEIRAKANAGFSKLVYVIKRDGLNIDNIIYPKIYQMLLKESFSVATSVDADHNYELDISWH